MAIPHALDPNRWNQIESLFFAALELEPAARLEFVQNQSQGDQELADEVISLLRAVSGAAGFLAKPLSNLVKDVAAEQTLDRLREGAELTHYKILSKIGAGGMGQVYLAVDTRLRRKIALKVLAPYLTHDIPALQRFEQEARAASALNHPNILTIFEFGETDGLHFIASEFIEGPTLRQRLLEGRLDVKTALSIAIQIVSALVAAHSSGIIHRDIKPENVLLRGDGLVKIVDFGIAKLGIVRPEGGAITASGEVRSSQTQPGMVVGTVRYMSPEQAQKLAVDGRSDLFTVGSVMYEMLAGTPAFFGENNDEIVHRVSQVDPPGFLEFGIEVPPEFELIIAKTMRKEREARYQTARDLLVDLQQFQKKLEFEANLIRAGYTPSGNLRARPLGEAISGSNSGARPVASSTFSTLVPQLPRESKAGFSLRRLYPMFLIAVVVLLAVIAGLMLMKRSTPAATADNPRSIAILPFRNLNRDMSADFLQVSLADALTTKLGYIKSLTVRPSSAVQGFRNTSLGLEQIADQLKVNLLLTGDYEKDGNVLKISTQLMSVNPNAVLWRRSITIPYDELLTVQDRLAQQIIEGLSLKLSAAESQRISVDRPGNTTAYEYYLRGVDFYSLNEFDEAIEALNKSISLEPDYALAWAQLGRAYTTHASLQFGGREQYIRAKTAYTRALSLDPGLVEVRVYMANLLTDTGRVEEAVPLLREALQTDPSFAEAHWELGYAYRFAGLLDESVAEAEQSRRLNPEVKMNSSAINAYLYRGEYRKFLASLPAGNSGYSLFYRGLAEYYLNDFEQAEVYFDRAYQLDRATLPAPIGEAISDGMKHQAAEGLKLLQDTETRFDAQGVSDPEMQYKLAQAYALLGDTVSALRVLQQSADGGFFCSPYLEKDPLLNSLRSAPKFKKLQAQVRTRHDQFKQRFVAEHAQGK